MYRLLDAVARLVLALTSMLILLAVLFGVPILFVAGIESIYCFVTNEVFTWNRPILIGIGVVIFICLVVSDAKH